LAEIGLESERIEMFNLSSAMGSQFAQMADEMVQQIEALGPNPLREL
jgi:coenzyme F420-reducing hydrogenase delta subunit